MKKRAGRRVTIKRSWRRGLNTWFRVALTNGQPVQFPRSQFTPRNVSTLEASRELPEL